MWGRSDFEWSLGDIRDVNPHLTETQLLGLWILIPASAWWN